MTFKTALKSIAFLKKHISKTSCFKNAMSRIEITPNNVYSVLHYYMASCCIVFTKTVSSIICNYITVDTNYTELETSFWYCVGKAMYVFFHFLQLKLVHLVRTLHAR